MSSFGCAIAPLNTSITARTLGVDRNNFKVNLPILGVQYERGLKENWDVGTGLEYQLGSVFNLYTKYAFFNNQKNGFSLAALLGGGYGLGAGSSKSLYAGPIVSYRYNWFEPFLAYRKNYVRWKNNLTPNQLDRILNFIPRLESFNYDQFDGGVNFVGEKFAVGVGAKVLIFKTARSAVPFIDFGYTF